MATRRQLNVEPQWSEAMIGQALAHQLFSSRSVLVVPNCNWTGSEADLLIIEPGLRIIDVEIKISRADLKADMKKEKWWHSRTWSRRHEAATPRQWPDKVWKHYYALPHSIWDATLVDAIPITSGVLTLSMGQANKLSINVIRKAAPNKDAKPIQPADAIDIARLASLRMWNALTKPTKEMK